MRETCEHCKRPRADAADLQRWRDEVNGGAEFFPGFYKDAPPEPSWSRELCWTTEPQHCHRRPLT